MFFPLYAQIISLGYNYFFLIFLYHTECSRSVESNHFSQWIYRFEPSWTESNELNPILLKWLTEPHSFVQSTESNFKIEPFWVESWIYWPESFALNVLNQIFLNWIYQTDCIEIYWIKSIETYFLNCLFCNILNTKELFLMFLVDQAWQP